MKKFRETYTILWRCLSINKNHEGRPFIEAELPLDTVLNPGMMVWKDRGSEEASMDSSDGTKKGPAEEN
jgi:hypothetical protein